MENLKEPAKSHVSSLEKQEERTRAAELLSRVAPPKFSPVYSSAVNQYFQEYVHALQYKKKEQTNSTFPCAKWPEDTGEKERVKDKQLLDTWERTLFNSFEEDATRTDAKKKKKKREKGGGGKEGPGESRSKYKDTLPREDSEAERILQLLKVNNPLMQVGMDDVSENLRTALLDLEDTLKDIPQAIIAGTSKSKGAEKTATTTAAAAGLFVDPKVKEKLRLERIAEAERIEKETLQQVKEAMDSKYSTTSRPFSVPSWSTETFKKEEEEDALPTAAHPKEKPGKAETSTKKQEEQEEHAAHCPNEQGSRDQLKEKGRQVFQQYRNCPEKNSPKAKEQAKETNKKVKSAASQKDSGRFQDKRDKKPEATQGNREEASTTAPVVGFSIVQKLQHQVDNNKAIYAKATELGRLTEAKLLAEKDTAMKHLNSRIESTLQDMISDGHAPSPLHFISPKISATDGLHTFTEWRRTLWFAPQDMSVMIHHEPPHVECLMVPYCSFDTVVQSHCSAEVADGRSTKGFSSTGETTYSNVLVLAALLEESTDCTAKAQTISPSLFEAVEEWDTSTAKVVRETKEAKTPVVAGGEEEEEEERNLGTDKRVCVKALPATQPQDAWAKAQPAIARLEEAKWTSKLGKRHGKVSGVTVSRIVCKDTSCRVLMVPVFLLSYQYEGSKCYYVVNATTGKGFGKRPGYGMGKILGGGVKLLEGVFGVEDETEPAMVLGKHLAKRDNNKHYKPEATYLIFPPSQSYLITSAVGFVTLTNVGKDPISLSSYFRGGKRVASVILAPGDTETFDYKGNWAIEVEGDPSTLRLEQCKTAGGGDASNSLCMRRWGL